MKTLLLIRHAKSDWENNLPDHERPLNKRGRHNAPMMGKRLARQDILPELLVSSSAVRARETARLVAQEIGYPPSDIQINARIYDAMTSDLQQVVAELPHEITYAALFGHNPGFTIIVNMLCPILSVVNLPTCGMVALHFACNTWEQVPSRIGELGFYDYPKKETP